jgi:ribose transport system substrate-binding protein
VIRGLPKSWFAVALLLAGCTCGGEAAPAGGGGGGGSAPTPNAERRTIAVIPKGTTHVFWRSVHSGALRAATELDVDIVWQGPVREDDRAGQIRVVEDMVTRGVDAIVLAPLDDTALVPAATEATRENIPVVIFDSGIRWDGYVSYVSTDNRRGGAIAAERLGDQLGGRGKVLVMRYQEGSASTSEREAGFLARIREVYPNIEIVSDNQYGGATTETAYATAENLLVRFPDVQGIFTPNESTTMGMLRALSDANRAGQVKHVGFDASDALVAALREGKIHGLVLQNPVRMGDLAVRAAVQQLFGRAPERRIDTGAVVVTRETMDQPEMRALLQPDLSNLN